MATDWRTLWDFSDPAASERRFQAALGSADPAEAVLLGTQIARTWGLRRDFARTRLLLEELTVGRDRHGGEAEARWWLEWGRSCCSATHDPSALTDADRAAARNAYDRAFEAARKAGLHDLAADALHMQAFVETTPAGREEANRRALAFVLASDQPAARSWEASLRNNLGMALHEAGRPGEALREFETALGLRRAGGDEGAVRVARWMVAWTLRHLGRLAEALAAQKALEADCAAAGEPDPFVFEELELLYRALGQDAEAGRYAALRAPRGS